MRRNTAAISPLAVGLAALALFGAAALAACAKDAADTTEGTDDAGSSLHPDAFTFYDTSVPPQGDAFVPPDFDSGPPPDFDSGPPPPPTCGLVGQPCSTDNDNCPFFAFLKCEKAVAPVDAGDAGDAGPQPNGVCVNAFDNISNCSAGKCAAPGAKCLLAADICLQAAEVPCVCGDGGAGSACGQ